MPLTDEEREAFLAEPGRVAVLGVAAGPGRGPLLVPIWFGYEPGGEPWILTGAHSRKAEAIRAAGRFSLLVERSAPTVRYVSVEGAAEVSAEADDGTLHRVLAARYLSGAGQEAYLEMASAQLSDHILIRMRPERWTSSDLGSWE